MYALWMDRHEYQKYKRQYRKAIWTRIRSISHAAHMWIHVLWVLVMTIIGGLLSAYFDFYMSWGTFAVAPWIAGIIGGLLAFLIGSTIVLGVLWQQASIEEYAANQSDLTASKALESEALVKQPNLSIEFPNVEFQVQMTISNSGGLAERIDIRADGDGTDLFRGTRYLRDSGISLQRGASHT